MPDTIFVTGASGFVGSAIVAELTRRGYAVRALVNRKPLPEHAENVTPIQGNLFDPADLAHGMHGCSAVIHLVGIIQEVGQRFTFERMHVEATRAVIEAARLSPVHRYIHMSALGTRPNAESAYHQTKYHAEELVRASRLDWTIFRPSMIHGPGGEFMQMEARWARGKAAPYLFMPYFGAGLIGAGGSGQLQPVFVGDVARAFVDAIENRRTIGKTYALAGNEQMDWPQMHRIASKLIIGKTRLTLPIPAWKAKILTHIVPSKLLPFNRAQVIMSQEDNVGDTSEFINDFGWEPVGFEESLREYAGRL